MSDKCQPCRLHGGKLPRFKTKNSQLVLTEAYVIFDDWITIPKGYRWGTSRLHRFLRKKLNRKEFSRALLVHGYLKGRRDIGAACNDQLLLSILLEDGVPYWLAISVYFIIKLNRKI